MRLDYLQKYDKNFPHMDLTEKIRLHALSRADLEAETLALQTQVKQLQSQLASATQIAFYDSLTGLPNRHGYDRYVATLRTLSRTSEFQVALDHGRGGGLLIAQVDIDHFKSINTMLTHFGGDAVLRDFASRLAKGTRMNAAPPDGPAKGAMNRCLGSLIVEQYMVQNGMKGSDLISRWGGEEFFCLFPLCYRNQHEARAAYDDADKIVQRLMDRIRSEPIIVPVNDQTYENIKYSVIGNPDHYYQSAKLIDRNGKNVALPISASIGYAVVSWEELMSHASEDTAHLFRNVVDLLRRAKETGRNRAVTVRAAAHDNRAAIHVYEGRALHKTTTAEMLS